MSFETALPSSSLSSFIVLVPPVAREDKSTSCWENICLNFGDVSGSFIIEFHISLEFRIFFVKNSLKSFETSGCLRKNKPCKTNGPTFVGSTGSNIHFRANQFVASPTIRPPMLNVQGLEQYKATINWIQPSKNPNHKPLSTKKSNSVCPVFSNNFPSRLRSFIICTTTQFRTLNKFVISRCIARVNSVKKDLPNHFLIIH
mmetsp:Transcript_10159/g.15520  ORF Transcript_10159/g.15520 Transcript_10159/m.15520 type:complete len:201 (+) Transcript_10159:636-1238(+)